MDRLPLPHFWLPNVAPSLLRPFAVLTTTLLLVSTACSSGSNEEDPPGQGIESVGSKDSKQDGSDSPSTGEPSTETSGTETSSETSSESGTSQSDSNSSTTAGEGTESESGEEITNCGDIVCEGNGRCVEDEMGAHCVCDQHYVLDETERNCVVDEGCIRINGLEEECRQVVQGAPAVGLFFSVDFCAGTAVTPEKFDELGLDFLVLENGTDITENTESSSRVLDKDVESFVTIVLDVSNSVTESENLAALIQALRDFTSDLKPANGEPKVFVELFVFGREVEPYVQLTENFDQVDTALEEIQSNPSGVTSEGNGGGTSLYKATEKGILHVQRNRLLRRNVTRGGVLSTGTVVVITDGKDTSNGSLDEGLVRDTLNQVISVGISDDVDDDELTRIGKDGSFLAPTPASWPSAFSEISDRVKKYPDRAYFLAYCSSATEGEPTVTIDLSGIESQQTASCRFDADLFASNPPVACDVQTFGEECELRSCGGMSGCGACDDNECCNDIGQCISPGVALDCDQDDSLCVAQGKICQQGATNDDPDECVDPPAIDELCADQDKCNPGISWCEERNGGSERCSEAKGIGDFCEDFQECVSQRCDKSNPNNDLEPEKCLPAAEIYDRCSSNRARCENGSYCSADCEARRTLAESCSENGDCQSGVCDDELRICRGSAQCYWSWDEKITI